MRGKIHEPTRDAETELLVGVALAMRDAFKAEAERGISKATITAKAGLCPESVRRDLDGRQNFTLRTLARLADACGRRVVIEFPKRYKVAVAEIHEKRAEPKMPSKHDLFALISQAPIPRLPVKRSRAGQGNTATVKTTKGLLFALARMGYRWCSVREVAEESGVCKARVHEMIGPLKTARLIEVERRPRQGMTSGSGEYRFRVRSEILRGLILGTMTIGGPNGKAKAEVALGEAEASAAEDAGREVGEDRGVGCGAGVGAEEA